MNKIDLSLFYKTIETLGNAFYEKIMALPNEVRNDTKKRPGVQIFISEQFKDNACAVSIKSPLFRAVRLAYKKAILCEDFAVASSANVANPELERFPGCIVIRLGEIMISISVSGLLAIEDIALGIIIGHSITGLSVDDVIENVRSHKGMLPEEIFQDGHYLKAILDEFR